MTPGQLREEALAEFTEWFKQNYPGPNTIISNPAWHAPKIFRSATHRLDKAHAAALEEIELLKEGEALMTRNAWAWKERAEKAEAERDALKRHAEDMRDGWIAFRQAKTVNDHEVAQYEMDESVVAYRAEFKEE